MSPFSFPWDAKHALKLLQSCSKLMKDENASENALRKLQAVASSFYRQALDPHYKSSLTGDQHLELERCYADLADWAQSVIKKVKLFVNHHPQTIIPLQVR